MKLYERITADNWHKGTDNGLCLLGHAMIEYGYRQVIDIVLPRLIEAIDTLYPERGNSKLPFQFNDHDDTVLEDVIRVCKLADV